MTPREDTAQSTRGGIDWTVVAVGWLVISSPLLAFPEFVWPGGREAVAAAGVISLGLAVKLAFGLGPLRYFVAVLALMAVVGWVRVADRQNALAHFGGLSLGILSMAVVARWCATQKRLVIAGALFQVLGLAALMIGLSSTIRRTKVISVQVAERVPSLRLSLPGLNPESSSTRTRLAPRPFSSCPSRSRSYGHHAVGFRVSLAFVSLPW